MKSKKVGSDHFGGLSRRDALKSAAAASLGVASGAFAVPSGKRSLNIPGKDFIRQENSKKGTRDWRLTKTKTIPGKINKILDNGRSKAIEEERFSWRVRVRDVEVQNSGPVWVIEDGSNARLIKFSSPN